MTEHDRDNMAQTGDFPVRINFDPSPLSDDYRKLYDEVTNAGSIWEAMLALSNRFDELSARFALSECTNADLRKRLVAHSVRLSWQGERIGMLAGDEAAI
jgi:hypothetical protein